MERQVSGKTYQRTTRTQISNPSIYRGNYSDVTLRRNIVQKRRIFKQDGATPDTIVNSDIINDESKKTPLIADFTIEPSGTKPRINDKSDTSAFQENTFKKTDTRTKKRFTMTTLLYVFAGIVFIFGLTTSYNGWVLNKKIATQASVLATQNNKQNPLPTDLEDDQVPSEELPKGTSYRELLRQYFTTTETPKQITIEKIDVEARILPLGLTKSGAIQAPSTIYDTGWYEKSARLGEPGATFIDGHVHGITKPGVFYKLKDLRSGDKITITRSDNKEFTYQVEATKAYAANNVDMREVLTPFGEATTGLNLMTCSGDYTENGDYNERLVVFTTLVTQ